jgi:hypothetical protein
MSNGGISLGDINNSLLGQSQQANLLNLLGGLGSKSQINPMNMNMNMINNPMLANLLGQINPLSHLGSMGGLNLNNIGNLGSLGLGGINGLGNMNGLLGMSMGGQMPMMNNNIGNLNPLDLLTGQLNLGGLNFMNPKLMGGSIEYISYIII